MDSPAPPPPRPALPVWLAAARVAFGSAGLALLCSFFAMGALFGEIGFSLAQAGLFTIFVYALPGQLVAAELLGAGAGLFAIAAAVWFVNARLLPMTVTLLALLGERERGKNTLANLATAHLVAVTSWVSFLGASNQVPPAQRRRFFVWTGCLLWVCGAASTLCGHWLGGHLPKEWLAWLLFLNPAYFLCVMLRVVVNPVDKIAFFCGMALLPLARAAAPEWDIVLAGVVGGSIAFYVGEWRARRARQQGKPT